MKTHEVTTYTIEELKAQFPLGYQRALAKHREFAEIPWQDETIESLKSLYNAVEIALDNYSLGAYNRNNYVVLSFPFSEQVENISGSRAMAWIESNLLSSLRIPWTGKRRKEARKYGSAYYADKVEPCPFTGYCADDDYLKELQNNIRSGMTLKDSFTALADTCQKLLENESEYQQSEECFEEECKGNLYEFTEDGERF